MTQKVRIVSQIVFFSFFLFLLYVVNRNGVAHQYPSELFLQLNPLVALIVSLASRTVVMVLLPGAIIIAVATLIFGRLFCGFACPLGAAIDFADHTIFKRLRITSRRPPVHLQRVKYVLLFATLFLAALGVLLSLFADPISLATRLIVGVFDPALRMIGLEGVRGYFTISNLLRGKEHEAAQTAVAVTGTGATLLLFLAVFAGGYWDRRFWCQYLCPSGAFFALLSKAPLLRRRVIAAKCTSCTICASHHCPTRAIDGKKLTRTSTAECILCGKCSADKRNCTVIGLSLPHRATIKGPDLSRRHVVLGVLGAAVALPLTRSPVFSSPTSELIRPPGALPEGEFLSRCLACGECIKICPPHALQPCGFSDGFSRLSTPKLVPRIGFCTPSCTACTQVCPTLAIRPISAEDKPFVKIGTALVDHGRCIAWRGERRCLSCIRKCPYQAITEEEWSVGEELTQSGPIIDKDLCTGCGACEFACPVTTTSAIRVQNYNEKRISEGQVISDNRRKKIIRQRKERLDGGAIGE